jgi:hypothetical protein
MFLQKAGTTQRQNQRQHQHQQIWSCKNCYVDTTQEYEEKYVQIISATTTTTCIPIKVFFFFLILQKLGWCQKHVHYVIKYNLWNNLNSFNITSFWGLLSLMNTRTALLKCYLCACKDVWERPADGIRLPRYLLNAEYRTPARSTSSALKKWKLFYVWSINWIIN